MKKEKLPNFFIIGAPKAGTTALSEYLREHPQVFFSEPKEPHYFNDDFSARHTYDYETYLSYFTDVQPEHKAIGEGSVFYLSSKNAVSNILKKVPDAKFIVMLRDPVSMAQSWHAQAIHSFGETVLDFEKAWYLQEERKIDKNNPKINRVREALQYGELCKVGTQVGRLLEAVPKEKIKFIIFNDFKSDVQGEYAKVLDFLDLNAWYPESFEQINAGKGYKNIWLKKITDLIPYYKKKFGIKFNFNLGLWKKINSFNTTFETRKPITPTFRGELINYFYEDVKLLSSLLDRDLLDEWKMKK